MTPIFQKKTFFLFLLVINMSSRVLCSAAARGSGAPAANARRSVPNDSLQIRVACAQATAPIRAAVGRVEAAQTAYQIGNHLRQTTQTALLVHAHKHAVQTELTQIAHTEELDSIHQHVARIESNQRVVTCSQAMVLGLALTSLLFTIDQISSARSPVCLQFSNDPKIPMLCYQTPHQGATPVINVEEAIKMQKIFTHAANLPKEQSFTKQVKALKKQCANARAQLKRNNRNQMCYNPRASFNKKKK